MNLTNLSSFKAKFIKFCLKFSSNVRAADFDDFTAAVSDGIPAHFVELTAAKLDAVAADLANPAAAVLHELVADFVELATVVLSSAAVVFDERIFWVHLILLIKNLS